MNPEALTLQEAEVFNKKDVFKIFAKLTGSDEVSFLITSLTIF